MRFLREDTPTIMDGLVIRWRWDCDWPRAGEISASRNGVLVSGAWPVMNSETLAEFREVLDEAERQWKRLAEEDKRRWGWP